MLLRLLTLAGAPVELAEAEVAVGDEGAHSQFVGEGERMAVMVFSVEVVWIASSGERASRK